MSLRTTKRSTILALLVSVSSWFAANFLIVYFVPIHLGYCSDAAVGVYQGSLVLYEVSDYGGTNTIDAWFHIGGPSAASIALLHGSEICPENVAAGPLRQTWIQKVITRGFLVSVIGNFVLFTYLALVGVSVIFFRPCNKG
jgi:hypothetical protein